MSTKSLDLTGELYGKLTVLEQAESIRSPSGRTLKMWLCGCECGEVKEVRQSQLRNGGTKSCGCLRKAPVKINVELELNALKALVLSQQKILMSLTTHQPKVVHTPVSAPVRSREDLQLEAMMTAGNKDSTSDNSWAYGSGDGSLVVSASGLTGYDTD